MQLLDVQPVLAEHRPEALHRVRGARALMHRGHDVGLLTRSTAKQVTLEYPHRMACLVEGPIEDAIEPPDVVLPRLSLLDLIDKVSPRALLLQSSVSRIPAGLHFRLHRVEHCPERPQRSVIYQPLEGQHSPATQAHRAHQVLRQVVRPGGDGEVQQPAVGAAAELHLHLEDQPRLLLAGLLRPRLDRDSFRDRTCVNAPRQAPDHVREGAESQRGQRVHCKYVGQHGEANEAAALLAEH
mmetsp:Transcript_148891/g.478332  ORF Transcript_148891/g.478332 Transcript_148891/m.478332 type:complete len:240 (-) Transcript_148891:221-940(-)